MIMNHLLSPKGHKNPPGSPARKVHRRAFPITKKMLQAALAVVACSSLAAADEELYWYSYQNAGADTWQLYTVYGNAKELADQDESKCHMIVEQEDAAGKVVSTAWCGSTSTSVLQQCKALYGWATGRVDEPVEDSPGSYYPEDRGKRSFFYCSKCYGMIRNELRSLRTGRKSNDKERKEKDSKRLRRIWKASMMDSADYPSSIEDDADQSSDDSDGRRRLRRLAEGEALGYAAGTPKRRRPL